MRILIFGRTGQVARELARFAWPDHCQLTQLGRAECDLLSADSITRSIAAARADVVINAAAYTAVDQAEREPEIAEKVNRDAPAVMAAACHGLGSTLIHLSTDYVFDGRKAEAYEESDPISPLSVYGRTKAEGELAIAEVLPQHVIIRTSWVFAAHGANFVRTMLRLANERDELRIVDDQKGGPTAARDIANALGSVALRGRDGVDDPWGLFHFTGAGPTTWFGFAQAIFTLSGQRPRLVPIASADFPTSAQRPRNSVLNCDRISRAFGVAQPSWRLGLEGVLTELDQMAGETGGTHR